MTNCSSEILLHHQADNSRILENIIQHTMNRPTCWLYDVNAGYNSYGPF